MNKKIQTICSLVCTVGVLALIPLFITRATSIEVSIPQISEADLEAKKEEVVQAQRIARRQARLSRIYSCQADEDCIIVDKDPCGCAVGPKGVTAINVNYITDFNELNNQPNAKACPDVIAAERECSVEAHAVCRAKVCKITF